MQEQKILMQIYIFIIPLHGYLAKHPSIHKLINHISSIKSISIILSIVSIGDLSLTGTLLEARDRVCCLVKDSDKVLNQGANSSKEEMVLMVNNGSPATIGLGGICLPNFVLNSLHIRTMWGTKS